jgi:hypothetical protein
VNELGDYIAAPLDRTPCNQRDAKEQMPVLHGCNQSDTSACDSRPTLAEELEVSHTSVKHPVSAGREVREQGWRQDNRNQRSTVGVSRGGIRRAVRNPEEVRRVLRSRGSRGSAASGCDGSQSVAHRSERQSDSAAASSVPQSRLSRTIVTGDRRMGQGLRGSSQYGDSAVVEKSSSTVSITVVTESQDARRMFPNAPPSVSSVAGTDRRSDRKSTVIIHSK